MLGIVYYASLVMMIVAAVFDLGLPLVISNKYKNYSHLRHTISSLGTACSPVSKFQNINLIIVGVLIVGFDVGEYIVFSQVSFVEVIYSLGIMVYAVGCIVAGVFPADEDRGNESLVSKIHGIASGIGFLALIFCPLVAIWGEQFTNSWVYNCALFIAGVISFVLFVISERYETGLLSFTGLFQRINLVILYFAVIINFWNLALIK